MKCWRCCNVTIRSVTTPPKIDPDEIFNRFDGIAKGLLIGLHAGLMQLSEAGWVDDDYYDSLLMLWSTVTGTAFRDTLPTYTLEVNGEPMTGASIVGTVERLQAIRPPEECERLLQAEPISIFGVYPTMSDETQPPDDPNVGGPPNTAGVPPTVHDTTQATAEAALYYDPARRASASASGD